MEPIVDGLEKEFAGQANVYKLNALETKNAALMTQYGLRGHPAFAVIDSNGRVRQTFVGPQTKEILSEALSGVLAVKK